MKVSRRTRTTYDSADAQRQRGKHDFAHCWQLLTIGLPVNKRKKAQRTPTRVDEWAKTNRSNKVE